MSQSNNSLFVKCDGNGVITLLLYVDDIILTRSNSTKVQAVIQESGGVWTQGYGEVVLFSRLANLVQR